MPDPPVASSRFGRSIDLDGDRLVVGAWRDDTAATDAGAAYVFDWDGAAWVQGGRLVRAGVEAQCRQVMGTMHGTEIFAIACPEISRETAASIARFAHTS